MQLLDYIALAEIDFADIEFVFMPPTSMADSLANDDIDGFCSGGPYNASVVRKQSGATIVTSYDIWEDRPEKVLGITAEAYEQSPQVYHRLCAALIDACEWLKDVPNRFEAARVLSKETYLATPIDYIAPSLIGSCLTVEGASPRHIPHYNRFCSMFASTAEGAYSVNRPSLEQGEWLFKKVVKAWPHLCSNNLTKFNLDECFREDIFLRALACRLS